MILVYFGRWSYERFQDDNNIFFKMKSDLTTRTWQDDIWCPIIIISFCTSNDIGRLDIYDNSTKYDIEDDCYTYEVILRNNLTHYVSFGQIHDIIGDEEWLQGEGNCLCNIASSRIIYVLP